MKFTATFLSLLLVTAALYIAYRYNAHHYILSYYPNWTHSSAEEPSSTQPLKNPPPDKAEIGLLIQQQYQKTLMPPAEETLSEEDKLAMVQNALADLEHGDDEYDREVAVMTLGGLPSAESKQGLIDALNDKSKLVISQAIRQINQWPAPDERTEMLLTALQSSDEDTVEQTLLTINAVEDKKLISRLKQLTKHPNPDIREAAKTALNLAP